MPDKPVIQPCNLVHLKILTNRSIPFTPRPVSWPEIQPTPDQLRHIRRRMRRRHGHAQPRLPPRDRRITHRWHEYSRFSQGSAAAAIAADSSPMISGTIALPPPVLRKGASLRARRDCPPQPARISIPPPAPTNCPAVPSPPPIARVRRRLGGGGGGRNGRGRKDKTPRAVHQIIHQRPRPANKSAAEPKALPSVPI